MDFWLNPQSFRNHAHYKWCKDEIQSWYHVINVHFFSHTENCENYKFLMIPFHGNVRNIVSRNFHEINTQHFY